MRRTLLSVALWALVARLLAHWTTAQTGWCLFSLGLVGMLLLDKKQFARIAAWSSNVDAPPPPALGAWDAILALVYRRLRTYRHEIAHLNQHLNGMLLAAEALPDGMVTLDAAMAVTWCNQTASEHIGLHLETDRHHSLFNILRAPPFLRYARQTSWATPLILHLPGVNQDKTLLLQLAPYGVDQFLLVTRDITQMEKLETTRKEFVANVSHELRTPLTVLSGFLETLQDAAPGALTDTQRAYYQTLMMEQTVRMRSLVDDLLTLSALESATAPESAPVYLANLIHPAVEQAKALSEGQHVLTVCVDEDLAVRGVASELRSAISNLLTNAVRYTPQNGTITVRWYQDADGNACYTIQDTGIGIAADDIPRLAERFYRVDRSRSRATGGTGLGLAITKHVALRHDAKLRIESRYGEGSTFTLEFPAARIVQAQKPTDVETAHVDL